MYQQSVCHQYWAVTKLLEGTMRIAMWGSSPLKMTLKIWAGQNFFFYFLTMVDKYKIDI